MASSDGTSIIVTLIVISNLELTQVTAVGTLGTTLNASCVITPHEKQQHTLSRKGKEHHAQE